VAREAGHEVHVLDPYFTQTTPQSYRDFLKHHQFDVIGLTLYTLTFPLASTILAYSREALPHAVTMAGGPHPTSLPLRTLEELPLLDCVVLGEGEATFVELLDHIRRHLPFDSVKGIAYRKPGRDGIVANPPRELIANLDELPMPAYDLFPIEHYVPTPNLVRRYPTVATQITRGCPFQCAFCEYNLALGRTYRHKSPEKVIDELVYLKERYRIRGIVFRDSTLTVNPSFLYRLCEELIKAGLDLAWMCYSRTDVMSKYGKELLPLMKRAGCWQIGYGCESGNQKSLDLLRKKTTVQDNVVAVERTIRTGISCSTTWIIGLPGETLQDAWNTVELACRLGSHVAKFFLPVPYPGTELEAICRRDGGLRKDAAYQDYEFFMPNNPVYVNPLIGKEEMVKVLKRAYRRFYTTPRVLLRNLRQVTDWDSVRKYWDFVRLLI
jgi:anaerobic magnesium-protoporphyrin IX monomethyl ester cyclase